MSDQPKIGWTFPALLIVVGGSNIVLNAGSGWLIWVAMALLVFGGVGGGLWFADAARDRDTHAERGDLSGSVHG
jgi:hypothetical protein